MARPCQGTLFPAKLDLTLSPYQRISAVVKRTQYPFNAGSATEESDRLYCSPVAGSLKYSVTAPCVYLLIGMFFSYTQPLEHLPRSIPDHYPSAPTVFASSHSSVPDTTPSPQNEYSEHASV